MSRVVIPISAGNGGLHIPPASGPQVKGLGVARPEARIATDFWRASSADCEEMAALTGFANQFETAAPWRLSHVGRYASLIMTALELFDAALTFEVKEARGGLLDESGAAIKLLSRKRLSAASRWPTIGTGSAICGCCQAGGPEAALGQAHPRSRAEQAQSGPLGALRPGFMANCSC